MAVPKGKSGEHESVRAYREKLDSITDNTIPEADALNRLLEDYLREVKSEPPPPTEPE